MSYWTTNSFIIIKKPMDMFRAIHYSENSIVFIEKLWILDKKFVVENYMDIYDEIFFDNEIFFDLLKNDEVIQKDAQIAKYSLQTIILAKCKGVIFKNNKMRFEKIDRLIALNRHNVTPSFIVFASRNLNSIITLPTRKEKGNGKVSKFINRKWTKCASIIKEYCG